MQKKKGISLIVLVITIIVMIILAAAIILSLNNAGIIGNANKAVDETNIANVKAAADLEYAEYIIEETTLTEEALGEEITQKLIDNNTIKGNDYYVKVFDGETYVIKEGSLVDKYYDEELNLGDVILYDAGEHQIELNQYTGDDGSNDMRSENVTIKSTSEMEWRLLGVEGNKLKIVSKDVVNPVGKTKFSLYGAYSYLKAEEILNTVCSIFGKGYGAIESRSINLKDINQLTKFNEANATTQYVNHGEKTVKYGTVIDYEINYPNIKGENYLTEGKVNLKITDYSYSLVDYLDSSLDIYSVLNQNYFVATTSVGVYAINSAMFNIRIVSDGKVNVRTLYLGGDTLEYDPFTDEHIVDVEYGVLSSLLPVVILDGNKLF